MIQVSVSQHHGIERGRIEWKRQAISGIRIMRALHEAAINQDPRGTMLEKKAGPRDRTGGAQELKRSNHIPSWHVLC